MVDNNKYYNGRVLCIDNKYTMCFTVGKIYPCINGKLFDDDENENSPYATDIKSFADICKDKSVKFIEVIGEVTINE